MAVIVGNVQLIKVKLSLIIYLVQLTLMQVLRHTGHFLSLDVIGGKCAIGILPRLEEKNAFALGKNVGNRGRLTGSGVPQGSILGLVLVNVCLSVLE